MEVNDYNRQVIAEFRANSGRVGGAFGGAALLLLHHRGARTGVQRVTPVMYRRDDVWVVFASSAGAPTNPDWYHNLLANPDSTIEVGGDTIDVTASVADPATRDRLWTSQKHDVPQFAEYEAATSRTIPVVLLHRR